MSGMDSIPDIEVSKKLIQLVKTQAFLYDKNLEDYKNESKKNEAWKRIAEALNLRGMSLSQCSDVAR